MWVETTVDRISSSQTNRSPEGPGGAASSLDNNMYVINCLLNKTGSHGSCLLLPQAYTYGHTCAAHLLPMCAYLHTGP